MTKKVKILALFLLILFILILYLILTSESVKKIDNSSRPAKNQTTVLSEGDYKAEIKKIFTAYEKLSQDNNLTTEKIAELKDRLLALKGLPAKFKVLHINLVLALDRMADYLKQKNQQEKNSGQQIINQLKANYSWLND